MKEFQYADIKAKGKVIINFFAEDKIITDLDLESPLDHYGMAIEEYVIKVSHRTIIRKRKNLRND